MIKKDSLTAFASEFIGTLLLLAIVTGSGIMGERLGAGNLAVALLGNSIATGCGLYVLITLLAPLSGAHFNPIVSMLVWHRTGRSIDHLFGYILLQTTGAIAGVWLTHLLFSLPIIQFSEKPRHSFGIWVSEFVASLILLGVIHLGVKSAHEKMPMLVAMTVTAGYWFSSSTFFANPAVTLARSLTDTFVGINPADILEFVSAQIMACLLVMWITSKK